MSRNIWTTTVDITQIKYYGSPAIVKFPENQEKLRILIKGMCEIVTTDYVETSSKLILRKQRATTARTVIPQWDFLTISKEFGIATLYTGSTFNPLIKEHIPVGLNNTVRSCVSNLFISPEPKNKAKLFLRNPWAHIEMNCLRATTYGRVLTREVEDNHCHVVYQSWSSLEIQEETIKREPAVFRHGTPPLADLLNGKSFFDIENTAALPCASLFSFPVEERANGELICGLMVGYAHWIDHGIHMVYLGNQQTKIIVDSRSTVPEIWAVDPGFLREPGVTTSNQVLIDV